MVDTHDKKLGLRVLEAQVVSLLGARNLASMRGKGKLSMLVIHDNILYFRYKKT